MKRIKVFYHEECATRPGKYIIRADLDKFFLNSTTGSFHVVQARLMGLTYAQYLRMCRDIFGAEIVGKGQLYPVAYFTISKGLHELIEQLNARANFVLWEREHPDFEEHAAYVKEKTPIYYAEVIGNVNNS